MSNLNEEIIHLKQHNMEIAVASGYGTIEATEGNLNYEQTKLSPKNFELTKVLGQGSFGKVFLVRKKSGRDCEKFFAMKVLQKSRVFKKAKNAEHMRSERNILATVKHPFIVELVHAFQTNAKLYFVLEYLGGGDMYSLLKRAPYMSAEDTRFYTSEIILALGYLHGLGVIYRDLKPANVLLDAEGHVKLTDFGLSKAGMEEGEFTFTFCGTVVYMAPEILNGSGHSKAVDWWSLGALMYEMLVGERPFSGKTADETITNICTRFIKFPSFVEADAKGLVKRLLTRPVWKRLGSGRNDALDVQSHPFFKHTNWEDVLARRMEPPFKPLLRADNDISQFDEEFTKQIPVETPQKSSHDVDLHFMDFSFEAPGAFDEVRPAMRKSIQTTPRRLEFCEKENNDPKLRFPYEMDFKINEKPLCGQY